MEVHMAKVSLFLLMFPGSIVFSALLGWQAGEEKKEARAPKLPAGVELPPTVVVRVEVDEKGVEKNPRVFCTDFRHEVTNEKLAGEAAALCSDAGEGFDLTIAGGQGGEGAGNGGDQPEVLGKMFEVAEQVYDNPHPPWRFSRRYHRGHFYGHGRGHHHGHFRGVPHYRRPHYGFHYHGRIYPYYPAPRFHFRRPYRYYYYHNPYYFPY